jgi:predicted TPR repeat methyltransferase
MKADSREILGRVNHLQEGDSSRDLYDDWSQNYDTHLLEDFGYISPKIAAQTLAGRSEQREVAIVDYGCGTGLVGEELTKQGFTTVDGVDISAGMLERAREKGLYRNLLCGDLTAQIALDDAVYDVAVCVGSMGAGHVGARHVPEMLRPLKAGGLFVITINSMHFAPEGFEQAFTQLEDIGLWRIHMLEQFNYMTQLDRPGWLVLAEKQ